MKRTLMIAPSLLLALLAPRAARATDFLGNINADTHWTVSGSPYKLTGDVIIAPQATLTIDPGVVVEAQANDGLGAGANTSKVELIVQGALAANGTGAQPIIIHGVSAGADVWYGITFSPGARASSITNAQISDASYAVYVRSTNPVTLSNLAVSKSATGLWWQSASGLQVQHSTFDTFTGNGMQIESGGGAASAIVSDCIVRGATGAGIQLATGVTAVVKKSQLVQSGTGLIADAGVVLTFVNNLVAGNKLRGLDLTQSGQNPMSVTNCTVDANNTDPWSTQSAGIGIEVRAVTQPSSFILRNDIVTNHGTAGIKVDGATAPAIDHNNVWQNGANYVGVTAGAASLSTNPLYTQPLTSSFVASPVSQQPLPNSFNNCSSPWVFTQAGALAIRLRLTDLRMEPGFDHLIISDGSGGTLINYSSTVATPTGSPPANGITIKACATSDGSGSSFFTIAGYEYLSPTYNYRLLSNSPVIDKGNDLDAPAEDCDGVARPYDGDTNGVATTDIGAYEFHQNVAPYASAGPDQIVLPSTTVSLSSAGSHDPDGTIVSYDWNFGDGSPHATTPNATHTYAALGNYTVTLTVTDDQGMTGTDTCLINVASNLPPTANAGPDQFAGVGATVSFDGGSSADPDGTIVGYAWNFGDASAPGSGRTPSHAYAAAGVYTVTLTVTDNRGATGTDTAAVVVGGGSTNQKPVSVSGGPYSVQVNSALMLDGSLSHDPDGTIASYAWDFGDGSFGTGAKPTHTWAAAGTYLLKLTVTDNGGGTADDSTLVTVSAGVANQPPVAAAGGNRSGMVGSAVGFDGSTSHDPDGTIAAYDWDFGDGTPHGTGAMTTHTYAAAGSYLIKLTVTDDRGATASDVALAAISTAGNLPPTAHAGGNRGGHTGVALMFDGSTSTDPDGTIASFDWDFGDGSAHGTGATVSHVFTTAGTYLVRLTVTDDKGATANDVAVATISDPSSNDKPPIVSTGGPYHGAPGQLISFDGSASHDPDGTIASYAWDFGDGASGTGDQPTHRYAIAGAYLVRLTITDDMGATATDQTLVTITAPSAGVSGGCSAAGGPPAPSGAALGLMLVIPLFLWRRRLIAIRA